MQEELVQLNLQVAQAREERDGYVEHGRGTAVWCSD